MKYHTKVLFLMRVLRVPFAYQVSTYHINIQLLLLDVDVIRMCIQYLPLIFANTHSLKNVLVIYLCYHLHWPNAKTLVCLSCMFAYTLQTHELLYLSQVNLIVITHYLLLWQAFYSTFKLWFSLEHILLQIAIFQMFYQFSFIV